MPTQPQPAAEPLPAPAWCGRVRKLGWSCVALGALTFWWYGVGFGLLLVALVAGLCTSRRCCRRQGQGLFWAALGTAACAVMILLFLLSGSEVGPTRKVVLPQDSGTRREPAAR